MAPVGHTASQSVHQSQIAVSTIATTGSSTNISPPRLQTLTHSPQPLHLLWSISGNIAISHYLNANHGLSKLASDALLLRMIVQYLATT
jgi:hypothetical protein